MLSAETARGEVARQGEGPDGAGLDMAGPDVEGLEVLPRVGVLPPVNLTEEPEYNAVRLTIYDTVVLTLRLIREFEVVPLERAEPELTEDDLLRLALENNLANVVFGRVFREDGDLVLEMSVYDTLQETTVLTARETPPGIFEVFDAADTVVARLVEEFSGVPVGFGTLVLQNTGEQGRYTVYLDGSLLGEDLTVLERTLMGERVLEVRQDRMFGQRVILQEAVSVPADRRTVVEFSVPYLLPEERQALEELEQDLEEEIERARSERRVERLFTGIEELLSVTGYSPAPEREAERIAGVRAAWEDDIEEWRRRMRPSWIFPVGVGWSGNMDPYIHTAFARGFGTRWYFGLWAHTFIEKLVPYPLLFGAYGTRPQRFLVTAALFAVPSGIVGDEAFYVPQIGVVLGGYSASVYFAINPSRTENNEIGFSVGYVF
jgi:hypothetical protein